MHWSAVSQIYITCWDTQMIHNPMSAFQRFRVNCYNITETLILCVQKDRIFNSARKDEEGFPVDMEFALILEWGVGPTGKVWEEFVESQNNMRPRGCCRHISFYFGKFHGGHGRKEVIMRLERGAAETLGTMIEIWIWSNESVRVF